MDNEGRKRILVLGAGGMLGNAVFRLFAGDPAYEVAGTLRTKAKAEFFPLHLRGQLIDEVDATSDVQLAALFEEFRPQIAINCIGLIKQQKASKDPLAALTTNSLLPHRLARQCEAFGARLIHLSTDCVFSGRQGMYREDSFADADDLYGRSKYLGEVDYPHTVTLRTSIIGHELDSCYSLIDWFLNQKGTVPGYTNAIFSGLPTIETARVIRDHVLPNSDISGVYHLSAAPIAKRDLLALVSEIYGHVVEIADNCSVVIDRSLDSTRFQLAVGYTPPSWPELIRSMKSDQVQFASEMASH